MESVLDRPDRLATALGGAALVVWGARKLAAERHPVGALMATTGAGLIWRSTRSDDTRARLSGSRGTRVEESFAINRAPEDLYEFWRSLELLPLIVPQLESVEAVGARRSHWVAKGPARWKTEWYADIINDIPNERIAWRTIDGSDLVCAGSIHFEPRPPGRGTVVRVKFQYDPPGGKLGAAIAWAFGDDPAAAIREGLRRFKQLMETGEMPTIEGQPRGSR
jgi:uncharacterized membrane protein